MPSPARRLVSRAGPLGGVRMPGVCVSLLARTLPELEAEAAQLLAQGPDLIEWRADFFDAVADEAAVLVAAVRLRLLLGATPLLFTLRSLREGGRDTGLGEARASALIASVGATGDAAFVDVEMACQVGQLRGIQAACRPSDTRVILSSHDFSATPPAEELLARFRHAAALGADVAKVAVMPRCAGDVLVLLDATERAARELSIPLVSMAMGPLGLVTRVFGSRFGSGLTFASGAVASAPGQIPLAELLPMLETLRRYGG